MNVRKKENKRGQDENMQKQDREHHRKLDKKKQRLGEKE